MSAHSQAPWRVTEARGPEQELCFYEVRNADGETILSTWPTERREEDARLAAAAPDLLAAAKRILADLNARIDVAGALGCHVPIYDGIAALDAAIKKAVQS